MTDLSDEIQKGHSSCLCPLCENMIEEHDGYSTVTAHGSVYNVHDLCLPLDDEEEEEND